MVRHCSCFFPAGKRACDVNRFLSLETPTPFGVQNCQNNLKIQFQPIHMLNFDGTISNHSFKTLILIEKSYI